ncbi:MAG: cupredoxin domain-containing protein [Thermoleophilaceae bacterium]|nr:cupredoxin domain-containing protein [Thermoleophilaceae bacterium]
MSHVPQGALDKAFVALGAVLVAATIAVAAFTLGDTAPGQASQPSASKAVSTNSVTIRGFKYLPPAVKVKAGSKVTFVNDDTAQHTASSPGSGTDVETATIKKGERKTITLDKAGKFSYVCDFHPFMKGAIEVE